MTSRTHPMPKTQTALALFDSMIKSGEMHSKISEQALLDARDEIRTARADLAPASREEIEDAIWGCIDECIFEHSVNTSAVITNMAASVLSVLTPAPEAGWRSMDSAPKDEETVFQGLFDNDEVIACRYLDNSKTRFPWAGYRPMYGADTPGRKLIAWQPMATPVAHPAPVTEQPSVQDAARIILADYHGGCGNGNALRAMYNRAYHGHQPYRLPIAVHGELFQAALRALTEEKG